jgi:putative peptidoglycan lipid II flippase
MLPAALGSGVVQINILIDIVIASLLPTGAVSYLYYADRIYELPLAVIGIAIGTAILPLLARQVRLGEHEAAIETQNRALEIALLLTLPAAAALIVLAETKIAVLFQRGAFGAGAVSATAAALGAYALGLPAYVLIKVLTPCFYARHDTATPVRIAVVCVIANTVAALILMRSFAHVGIAGATAISAWLNCLLLALALRKRGYFAPDQRVLRRIPGMIAASAVMAGALWVAVPPTRPWLAGHLAERAAALTGLVVLGLAVFGAAAVLFRAADLGEVRRLLRRARN